MDIFLGGGCLLNLYLLGFLFSSSPLFSRWPEICQKNPLFTSIFVLLPLIALTSTLHYDNWRVLLGALILVNFSMDTSAWFFGKNFGKNKLWPQVSPKKTWEGLIGGVLSSGLVGAFYWGYFVEQRTFAVFLMFAFLGLFSQIGDLVQSKFKRLYGLKDSSSLIPGHGGVYDRIDSLLFVAPFYGLALRLTLD